MKTAFPAANTKPSSKQEGGPGSGFISSLHPGDAHLLICCSCVFSRTSRIQLSPSGDQVQLPQSFLNQQDTWGASTYCFFPKLFLKSNEGSFQDKGVFS